jgi:hypothetical protein
MWNFYLISCDSVPLRTQACPCMFSHIHLAQRYMIHHHNTSGSLNEYSFGPFRLQTLEWSFYILKHSWVCRFLFFHICIEHFLNQIPQISILLCSAIDRISATLQPSSRKYFFTFFACKVFLFLSLCLECLERSHIWRCHWANYWEDPTPTVLQRAIEQIFEKTQLPMCCNVSIHIRTCNGARCNILNLENCSQNF